jgi:transcriptional regulator GlxA family with amidase domain
MSIEDAGKRASLEGRNPGVPESTRNRRVEIAIDFMKVNLHRRIPLAELARAVNLSPSHLSRLFKTQTRLTPGEYLRRLRMEMARQFLETSLMSIKEIMALVGYKSRSHFVRDFKDSFRLPPSEHRKRM